MKTDSADRLQKAIDRVNAADLACNGLWTRYCKSRDITGMAERHAMLTHYKVKLMAADAELYDALVEAIAAGWTPPQGLIAHDREAKNADRG